MDLISHWFIKGNVIFWTFEFCLPKTLRILQNTCLKWFFLACEIVTAQLNIIRHYKILYFFLLFNFDYKHQLLHVWRAKKNDSTVWSSVSSMSLSYSSVSVITVVKATLGWQHSLGSQLFLFKATASSGLILFCIRELNAVTI